MLVLTRKRGEIIRIGADVCVRVVQMNGSRVKIAIEAPKEVHILRGELQNRRPDLTDASKGENDPSDSTDDH